MRKLIPHIITAVVAITVSFAVSYFVSHSEIRVSIANGGSQQLSKHYTGSKLHDSKPKTHHDYKRPQFWGRGPEGFETALVKLTAAKEKGFLSEEEYQKVVSVLVGPIHGTHEVEVDIVIKTTIIEHDSDTDDEDE